jgi:hypothetical protein
MTITLTILEELNAKSVIVNAHPKVNAYKLWAFTLSVDLFFDYTSCALIDLNILVDQSTEILARTAQ